MNNYLRFTLAFFFLIFLSATIVNFIEYIVFAKSCAPKLGCTVTFQLVSLVVAICALVSSIGIYFSYLIVIKKQGEIISNAGKLMILMFGTFVSVSTKYTLFMMEQYSIAGVIGLYFIIAFISSSVIYQFQKIKLSL